MKLAGILMVALALACSAQQASSQGNPHYVSTDPAIREMLTSLDMPRSNTPDFSVVSGSLAGDWQLVLTEGRSLRLSLFQSGSRIFGRGNVTAGNFSEPAAASGTVSGSSLKLDVVPFNGSELYSISLGIGRLPLAGTYTLFSSQAGPRSGMVKASLLAA